MIQMQYRNKEALNGKWEIYTEYHRVTKTMQQFAKDLRTSEFGDYEIRYVDTKQNPGQAL